jgi:hypothetical protein
MENETALPLIGLISERKRLLEALHESECLFIDAVQHSIQS